MSPFRSFPLLTVYELDVLGNGVRETLLPDKTWQSIHGFFEP
ncbi:MAG: hypothetical protein AAGF46_00975 [Pseudomonadota bacterium]